MRFTFNQIIKSLPVKKNSNSSWWVKLWVRKISFIFTFFFINLGFTSNSVSVLSVLITLLASMCFMIPNYIVNILGMILINFWLILDCVDGNIARCNKQKTVYGEFIDDISGYFTTAFIYMSIGVAAFHSDGLFFSSKSELILIFGAMSSISDILARLIHKDYVCFGYEKGVKNNEKVGTFFDEDKKTISYVRKRIGKEIGISGLFMPFVIISAIINCYDLITIFYMLFNLVALISTSALLFYKANKYDRGMKNEAI